MAEVPTTSEQPIRLTLRWVAAAFGLLFAVGVLGGAVGQQLFTPPLPPLSSGDQMVTQVQEVTISPNTATADVVATVGRSVVLLGTRVGAAIQPAGTAVVVTNDGVLVTTLSAAGADMVAIDDTGAAIALEHIGRDPLFGLSYWRMPQAVVVPIDVRREPVTEGSELLIMSRSDVTRHTKVMEYRVHEHSLSRAADPAGIQRVLQGTAAIPSLMLGAPVVDEEGRLAGLVLDTDGRVMEAAAIQQSLSRLATDKREFDPLAAIGMDLEYSFVAAPETPDAVGFTPRVLSVTPNSPAAAARVLRGDSIVRINNEPVTWEQNVAQQLSAALPLTLIVRRDGETLSLSLSPVAEP